jgi:hypothetical protein
MLVEQEQTYSTLNDSFLSGQTSLFFLIKGLFG